MYGPVLVRVRLERRVVHALVELRVARDEELVAPCVDRVRGADREHCLHAGERGVGVGEREELVVESGGRHW